MEAHNHSKILEITQGILPAYKKELKRLWEELLWEPDIVPFRDANIKIKGLEFYMPYYKSFVTPKGVLCRSFVNGEPELSFEEYVNYASSAERSLVNQYGSQLAELKSDPEGRDIIWRPGQERFGYYYSDGQPTEIDARKISIDPVKVRAKWDTENTIMRLYCPKHDLQELVYSMKVAYPQDNWTFCPLRDNCFRVCSNPDYWAP